jgi:hypothetical protein
MSLLRRVRAEWSGALRSVRYDMGQRPVEPPSSGPDMTSTGMNTFGGLMAEDAAKTPRARMPRRAALVTALGVLTVVGAAGAYLGVVNGLGSMLNTSQAEAGTVPSQQSTDPPNSGIGRGPAKAKNPLNPGGATPAPLMTPTDPAAPADRAADTAAAAAAGTAAGAAATGGRDASPIRTTNPTKGECVCNPPPVPTPTAPASSGYGVPSGSPSPSDSAYPSPSEPSATPDDSAEPSDSPQARHRYRHH